ncbi:copper(I)-binding protein [Neisseria perflava]|nr:copper(I)-binding protein [Neisseria perflava]
MKMKALLTAVVLSAICPTAIAAGIQVQNAWARSTVEGMKMGGAFMTLRNESNTPDTLIGGSSPVAERVEIHTHINDNGVMRMRQAKDGVALPANATTEMKPGGYHVMFMGLKRPLKAGEKIPVTLKFKQAKAQTVQVEVKNAPQQAASQHNHAGAAHQH